MRPQRKHALKPGKPLERKTELRRYTPLNDGGAFERTAKRAKRRPISPASKPQRLAVADQWCLGCGRSGSEWLAIDPAHVWARGRGGCSSRWCVIPLCRDFKGDGCHRRLDEGGGLDLLSIMVADWGRWQHHFQHALRHTTPVQLIERLAGSRVEWTSPVSSLEHCPATQEEQR